MIRVNLLPSKKESKRKTERKARAPGEGAPLFVTFIVFFALAAMGGFGYHVATKHLDSIKDVREQEDMIARKEKTAVAKEKEVAGLGRLDTILKNEFKAISALAPSDRVIWAEKLHQLKELRPNNVFLTTIAMKQDVKEDETPESKAARAQWRSDGSKGEEPRADMKLEIRQTLTLSGITNAERPDVRGQLMIDFHNAMLTHASKRPIPGANSLTPFMSGFMTPQYKNYDVTTMDSVEVLRFSFDLPTIPREG